MEEQNLYHFQTQGIDRYFHKDPNDADKYLVCTCARGENDYITEYVDHYLNKLGFDKIIICDNNDDDSLESVLSSYIDRGVVEIFDCRGFGSFQVQFYSMFAHEGNYKWCGFFDADEFLELNIHNNIKHFLEGIKEDCVSFNWLVYGDNNQYHKEPGSIQERFPMPVRPISMFKENVFVKSILRGGYDRFKDCHFNGSHIPMCSNENMKYNIGGYNIVDYQSHTHFPPRYKYGYIKHYYTKSFDEWIAKASRGWPDGTPTLTTSNYFICNTRGDVHVPIERFTHGFFIDGGKSKISENCKDILKKYTVINTLNSNKQVYAFIVELFELMSSTTDHTFVLSELHFTDELFNLCFEYAFETGNRVVYARGTDELWQAYLKYNHGEETYYILDLM
jgi:hypothetical protein